MDWGVLFFLHIITFLKSEMGPYSVSWLHIHTNNIISGGTQKIVGFQQYKIWDLPGSEYDAGEQTVEKTFFHDLLLKID